jgi:hypothetical protein
MKKVVSLLDDNGTEVMMSLDNWGSGVDRLFRRWVREGEAWRCIETGRTARQQRRFSSIFRKPVSRSFN